LKEYSESSSQKFELEIMPVARVKGVAINY
jgi:hypothetical protein